MKTKIILLLTIVFLFLFISYCSKYGQIEGNVFDQTNNKPIPDANITIADTKLITTSNKDGYFFIKKIPLGKHKIIVSKEGYLCSNKSELELNIEIISPIILYLFPKPDHYGVYVIDSKNILKELYRNEFKPEYGVWFTDSRYWVKVNNKPIFWVYSDSLIDTNTFRLFSDISFRDMKSKGIPLNVIKLDDNFYELKPVIELDRGQDEFKYHLYSEKYIMSYFFQVEHE